MEQELTRVLVTYELRAHAVAVLLPWHFSLQYAR